MSGLNNQPTQYQHQINLKTKQMRSILISEATLDECRYILDNGGSDTKDCKRFWWGKLKSIWASHTLSLRGMHLDIQVLPD